MTVEVVRFALIEVAFVVIVVFDHFHVLLLLLLFLLFFLLLLLSSEAHPVDVLRCPEPVV